MGAGKAACVHHCGSWSRAECAKREHCSKVQKRRSRSEFFCFWPNVLVGDTDDCGSMCQCSALAIWCLQRLLVNDSLQSDGALWKSDRLMVRALSALLRKTRNTSNPLFTGCHSEHRTNFNTQRLQSSMFLRGTRKFALPKLVHSDFYRRGPLDSPVLRL